MTENQQAPATFSIKESFSIEAHVGGGFTIVQYKVNSRRFEKGFTSLADMLQFLAERGSDHDYIDCQLTDSTELSTALHQR